MGLTARADLVNHSDTTLTLDSVNVALLDASDSALYLEWIHSCGDQGFPVRLPPRGACRVETAYRVNPVTRTFRPNKRLKSLSLRITPSAEGRITTLVVPLEWRR